MRNPTSTAGWYVTQEAVPSLHCSDASQLLPRYTCPAAWPCFPESACLGDNTCDALYAGTRCADCAASALRIGGRCVSCDSVLFLAFGLLALFVVLYSLNLVLAGKVGWLSCMVGVDYLQLLALLASVPVSSAPDYVTNMLNALTVFNFNPAFWVNNCWTQASSSSSSPSMFGASLSTAEAFAVTFRLVNALPLLVALVLIPLCAYYSSSSDGKWFLQFTCSKRARSSRVAPPVASRQSPAGTVEPSAPQQEQLTDSEEEEETHVEQGEASENEGFRSNNDAKNDSDIEANIKRRKVTTNGTRRRGAGQHLDAVAQYDRDLLNIMEEQHKQLQHQGGAGGAAGDQASKMKRAKQSTIQWHLLSKEFLDAYLLALAVCLSLLYCMLCNNALAVFNCIVTAPDDGYFYLSAVGTTPEGRCYESGSIQQQLAPWAEIALCFYGIGIPLLLLVVMRRFRSRLSKVHAAVAITKERSFIAIISSRFSFSWHANSSRKTRPVSAVPFLPGAESYFNSPVGYVAQARSQQRKQKQQNRNDRESNESSSAASSAAAPLESSLLKHKQQHQAHKFVPPPEHKSNKKKRDARIHPARANKTPVLGTAGDVAADGNGQAAATSVAANEQVVSALLRAILAGLLRKAVVLVVLHFCGSYEVLGFVLVAVYLLLHQVVLFLLQGNMAALWIKYFSFCYNSLRCGGVSARYRSNRISPALYDAFASSVDVETGGAAATAAEVIARMQQKKKQQQRNRSNAGHLSLCARIIESYSWLLEPVVQERILQCCAICVALSLAAYASESAASATRPTAVAAVLVLLIAVSLAYCAAVAMAGLSASTVVGAPGCIVATAKRLATCMFRSKNQEEKVETIDSPAELLLQTNPSCAQSGTTADNGGGGGDGRRFSKTERAALGAFCRQRSVNNNSLMMDRSTTNMRGGGIVGCGIGFDAARRQSTVSARFRRVFTAVTMKSNKVWMAVDDADAILLPAMKRKANTSQAPNSKQTNTESATKGTAFVQRSGASAGTGNGWGKVWRRKLKTFSVLVRPKEEIRLAAVQQQLESDRQQEVSKQSRAHWRRTAKNIQSQGKFKFRWHKTAIVPTHA